MMMIITAAQAHDSLGCRRYKEIAWDQLERSRSFHTKPHPEKQQQQQLEDPTYEIKGQINRTILSRLCRICLVCFVGTLRIIACALVSIRTKDGQIGRTGKSNRDRGRGDAGPDQGVVTAKVRRTQTIMKISKVGLSRGAIRAYNRGHHHHHQQQTVMFKIEASSRSSDKTVVRRGGLNSHSQSSRHGRSSSSTSSSPMASRHHHHRKIVMRTPSLESILEE